jgi:hypothetical protein
MGLKIKCYTILFSTRCMGDSLESYEFKRRGSMAVTVKNIFETLYLLFLDIKFCTFPYI